MGQMLIRMTYLIFLTYMTHMTHLTNMTSSPLNLQKVF